MGEPVAVVLAAGQGVRMRSDVPKVLHPLAGRPMVEHVVRAVRAAGVKRVVVVVGPAAEGVRSVLGDTVRYAVQDEPLGTGHACLAAAPEFQDATGPVLVCYGDAPLLTGDILRQLIETHARGGAACTMLTAELPDPTGYGRILRDEAGEVRGIVEERDATGAQRAIRECNPGIYAFDAPPLVQALGRLEPKNVQGEYYLTDVPAQLIAAGQRVRAIVAADPLAVLGVNSRRQLAEAEAILRRRILDRHMEAGVTVIDPATTYVDDAVTIGRDTVLYPMTVIEGRTAIGARCRVGPGSHLVDVTTGDDVTIRQSVATRCQVGDGVTVGPFAHLRPGTVLAPGAKVGNFAELKNARIGPGSKVPHHSYVGDATVGAGVNIGAGVVFVNYDGVQKHETVVGDGAFIGCNANLVAPLEIGRSAYVAAGSTVTRDVPADALGIGRARQENLEGWVTRRRRRKAPDGGDET